MFPLKALTKQSFLINVPVHPKGKPKLTHQLAATGKERRGRLVRACLSGLLQAGGGRRCRPRQRLPAPDAPHPAPRPDLASGAPVAFPSVSLSLTPPPRGHPPPAAMTAPRYRRGPHQGGGGATRSAAAPPPSERQI